jgi:hypothetical protein
VGQVISEMSGAYLSEIFNFVMADNDIIPSTDKIDNLISAHIPTWNHFSGQQSFCECEECEHMAGAPAYLAHILNWLEHSKPNDENRTPYELLIERAPYLPHMQLDCENTKLEMSYLRVCLHILEFFAVNKTLSEMPAYGLAGDQEKKQETSKLAYEILSKKLAPFSLPYHQPLDIIRTYLKAFNTSWHELLKFALPFDSLAKQRAMREKLRMSDTEYSLITEWKVDNSEVEPFRLYGFNSQSDFDNTIANMPVLLRRTDLKYHELIEILDTRYVNPGCDAVRFIENLFINSNIERKELFAALIEISEAPAENPLSDELKTKIQSLLDESDRPSIDPRHFKDWIDSNFESILKTVVIKTTTSDPCNYNGAVITSVGNSYNKHSPGPDADFFKRLYRFVKLLRKGDLSIKALGQLLIASVKFREDEFGQFLSVAYDLMERKLTSSEIRCLMGNIQTGVNSTYSGLFLNDSLQSINSAFKPDTLDRHLNSGVLLKESGSYNAVLLSGLFISPVQMDTLVNHLKIEDPESFLINLQSLSVFTGYCILSQKIELPIEDCLWLLDILDARDALPVWDKNSGEFSKCNLESLSEFISKVQKLSTCPFTISELTYVLSTTTNHVIANQFPLSSLEQILTSLKASFNLILQQHPDPEYERNIDVGFILNKLLLTKSKEDALLLVGMLTGSIRYGLTLDEKPDLEVPISLKNLISYDRSTGRIECTGVISAQQWLLIRQNNALEMVLRPIYEKPFSFLVNTFSDVFPTDADRNEILDRLEGTSNRTVVDKLKIFYSKYYYPYMTERLKGDVIIQQLSQLLELDEKRIGIVISDKLVNLKTLIHTIINKSSIELNTFTDSDLDELRQVVLTLYKSVLLIQRFDLNLEEIEHMRKVPVNFNGIDFTQITFSQWQAVSDFKEIRKYVKPGKFSVQDFANYRTRDQATIEGMVDFSTIIFGWPKEMIQNLIRQYNFSIDDLRKDFSWICMIRLITASRKFGLNPELVIQWIKQADDFESLYNLSQEVKVTFLQKLDEDLRKEKEKINDSKILEAQRDALVNYILNLEQIKEKDIRSIEELCEYMLIDVPMGSCMPTTPIRQAISTVQSFVAQCLNKKEIRFKDGKQVGVSPDAIDPSQWSAKGTFRVWQVTMEFLTNPWPYLSYKYLKEKGAASKALEEDLLKNDITARNVEDAYRRYLQMVAQTSNLEIVASYIDDVDSDNDSTTIIIHVIGRSRSAPHNYYYCKKNEHDRWTQWEKVDVAIKENDADGNGSTGAHVIFTKFKNRYYLILPEFIKRQEESDTSLSSPNNLATVDLNKFNAKPFWEVKLGISEYYNGKWSTKQYLKSVTEGKEVFKDLTESNVGNYIFTLQHHPGSIILKIRRKAGSTKTSFEFRGINSAILITTGYTAPVEADVYFQNFLYNELRFPVKGVNDKPFIFLETKSQKLINTPYPGLDLADAYSKPFFFHDKDRTYFVTSQPIQYTLQQSHYEDVPMLAKDPRLFQISLLAKPEAFATIPAVSFQASKRVKKMI